MLFFLLCVCEISYKKKLFQKKNALALNVVYRYSGILLALKRKETF